MRLDLFCNIKTYFLRQVRKYGTDEVSFQKSQLGRSFYHHVEHQVGHHHDGHLVAAPADGVRLVAALSKRAGSLSHPEAALHSEISPGLCVARGEQERTVELGHMFRTSASGRTTCRN